MKIINFLLKSLFLLLFVWNYLTPTTSAQTTPQEIIYLIEGQSGHSFDLPLGQYLCVIINDGSPNLPTYSVANAEILEEIYFARNEGAWYFYFSPKKQGTTSLIFNSTGGYEGSQFNFTIKVVHIGI